MIKPNDISRVKSRLNPLYFRIPRCVRGKSNEASGAFYADVMR